MSNKLIDILDLSKTENILNKSKMDLFKELGECLRPSQSFHKEAFRDYKRRLIQASDEIYVNYDNTIVVTCKNCNLVYDYGTNYDLESLHKEYEYQSEGTFHDDLDFLWNVVTRNIDKLTIINE